MNWKLLVFSIIIIVTIVCLTYLGILTLDQGLIFSLLSLFAPQIAEYLLKPKVALAVQNLEFVKKTFKVLKGIN